MGCLGSKPKGHARSESPWRATGANKKTYSRPLPVSLTVYAIETDPEGILDELINDLKAGNVEAALQKVAPSRQDQVRALDSNGLNRLADFLANARLVEATPTLRIYEGFFVDENGSQREGEFTLALTSLGKWKIVAW